MKNNPIHHFSPRRSSIAALLAVAVALIFAPGASAQQTYVGRWDAYVGYAYLNSPHISLQENGVHTQVGMRANRWLSLGFDYIRVAGSTTLTPNLLTTDLQTQLGGELRQLVLAGKIPPTYSLTVPIDSTTQTFSAGPQISYRHFKAVTLFIRPDLGAMREVAVPKPGDSIAQMVVAQLAPSGHKLDWVAFYGFGGGVDLNMGKRFSLRIQADLVHDHLFNDLLKDSRNTVRFAVGPGVQWGKSVK